MTTETATGLKDCHDCGAKPGDLHDHGCDCERCPRCGGQEISCGCIYEVCGMDQATLEESHPDIYREGPTAEMYAKWDSEWGSRRMLWTGQWPGEAECIEYGFYSRWVDGYGWVGCAADAIGAAPDLNRLHIKCRWDADKQRFVKR